MSSSTKLETVLMLIMIFLVGAALPSSPTVHANGTFPNRPWYFHYQEPSLTPVYTMNETSFPPLAPYRDSFHMGYCLSPCATQVQFSLNPSYPYGFDFVPGTAYLELWMSALNNSGSAFTGATARFSFNLSGSPRGTIGVGTGQISLMPSTPGGTVWTHSSLPFSIPSSYSIMAGSTVSLNFTWANPDPSYYIVVGANPNGQPSNLSVPADYYSTSLSLAVVDETGNGSYLNPYLVRFGESVRIHGGLTNLYNGSGVSGESVNITLSQITSQGHIIQLGLGPILTSTAGDYSYDWSPPYSTPLGVYWAFAFWPGTHNLAGNVSQRVPEYSRVIPFPYIEVREARTTLTTELAVNQANPGSSISIRGVLRGLNGPISGANVVLSFHVPGSGPTTITSALTDANGGYEAVWILQATGNFTITAMWSGTNIQDQGVGTAFLLSIPQGSTSVWASSSSAVSGLTFNTSTGKLSFMLSPPTQAGSSVTVYIPKSISGSKPNVPLTVDGTSIPYTVQDSSVGWQVSFSLPNNSTSQVLVAMGPLSATQGNIFVLATIGGLIAAASAGGVIFYWKRWPRRNAAKLSST